MKTDSISINLDNELIIRLSVYADSTGKKSLAEAIEHLLDTVNQDNQSPTNQPTIDDDGNGGNGDIFLFYHRPIVEYFADDDSTQIPEEKFRDKLLITKYAKVVLVYHSKSNEEKVWHAKNFTKNSSVKGNLNTGYLRNWRKKGIKKIQLYIPSR